MNRIQQTRSGLTRSRYRLIGLMVFTLCSALLTGCGTAPEAVDSFGQPLMIGPAVTLWPDGQVPICFEGRADSREAAWVKSALAHTWSAVAKIDFHFYDTCVFQADKSHIRIVWAANNGWGIGGKSGLGMLNPNYVELGYCSTGDCNLSEYEEAFKYVVAHEIGHALGFAHEHQRDDRVTPVKCNLERPRRADYPGTANGEQAYQGALNAWKTDRAVIKGGIKLSPVYDPDSIMNYCRGVTATIGTGIAYQAGYQAADRLSVWDLHGAQRVYRPRMPYWLIWPIL